MDSCRSPIDSSQEKEMMFHINAEVMYGAVFS